MSETTVIIPASDNTRDDDDFVRWDSVIPIADAFVPDGTTRRLRRFVARSDQAPDVQLRLFFDTEANPSTSGDGDDLVDAWETRLDAIIFSQGENSITIPGPNYANNEVRDSGDTYVWAPPLNQQGSVGFFFFVDLDVDQDFSMTLRSALVHDLGISIGGDAEATFSPALRHVRRIQLDINPSADIAATWTPAVQLVHPPIPLAGTASSILAHWLLTIDDLGAPAETRYWWSGEDNLVYDGITWLGTTVAGEHLMTVSPVEHTLGEQSRRATIQLVVTGEAVRRVLSQDPGPVQIRVDWLVSEDNGETFRKLARSFYGRLSGPTYQNGIYSAELETRLGDTDRHDPRQWSHENQLQLHPGDMGLEFARVARRWIRIEVATMRAAQAAQHVVDKLAPLETCKWPILSCATIPHEMSLALTERSNYGKYIELPTLEDAENLALLRHGTFKAAHADALSPFWQPTESTLRRAGDIYISDYMTMLIGNNRLAYTITPDKGLICIALDRFEIVMPRLAKKYSIYRCLLS